MGANGRARALEDYSSSTMASRMIEIYRFACGQRATNAGPSSIHKGPIHPVNARFAG
jgi:hypothetical protein